MGRPKVHGDRITTAIRLPVDLHERVAAAAYERDLSVNFLVVKAIEDFLPRLIPVAELTETHYTKNRKRKVSQSSGETP